MHGLKAWVNAVNGIENRRRRIADAYEQLGNYDEALTYVKKFPTSRERPQRRPAPVGPDLCQHGQAARGRAGLKDHREEQRA